MSLASAFGIFKRDERQVGGRVDGGEVISYPGESEDNSAAVLSAIKRISASQFLVLLLLQTTQLVFVVPNGQFLPYVLCCLNS